MDSLTPESCGITKPRRVVVPVRDPKNLSHLKKVLRETRNDTDVVVMSAKIGTGYQLEGDLSQSSEDEDVLFTQIIAVAEKAGHEVIPILIPSNDPFFAMARVAYDLGAQELAVGRSGKFSPELQMERIAIAWGTVRPKTGQSLRIRIIWEGSEFREDII